MTKLFVAWSVKFRAFGVTFKTLGGRERFDDDVRYAVGMAVGQALKKASIPDAVAKGIVDQAVDLAIENLSRQSKTLIDANGVRLAVEAERL